MYTISILLIIIMLILGVYAFNSFPTDAQNNYYLFSCYGVVCMLFVIYVFIPAISTVIFNKFEFVWAVQYDDVKMIVFSMALSIIAFIVFIYSYKVAYLILKRHITHKPSITLKPKAVHYWILLSIFIIGLMMKIMVVQINGGFSTLLLRLSGGISANLNIQHLSPFGNIVNTFSGVSGAASTVLLLITLRYRRLRVFAIVVFITSLTISLGFSGKRLDILWQLFAAVIAVHIYVRQIKPHMIYLILPMIFLFGFLSVMYRIYTPAYIAGINIDLRGVKWANGSLLKFYFNSLEFSSFEMFTMMLQVRDQIIDTFGSWSAMIYRTNIEPFLFIVPRAIWPGKPQYFVDISHAVTSLFGTGGLEAARYGTATTLLGTSWVFGGPIGLFLAMSLMGVLSVIMDLWWRVRSIQPSWMVIVIYAFFMMVVFHLFRQGTLGWTFIIVIVQQLGFISGIILLWLALPTRVKRPQSLLHSHARMQFNDIGSFKSHS